VNYLQNSIKNIFSKKEKKNNQKKIKNLQKYFKNMNVLKPSFIMDVIK
jgi:hypothetical protein